MSTESTATESITAMSILAEQLVRDIPDFPSPGILFKDITPVLASPEAVHEVIAKFKEFAVAVGATAIVGIESRGFVLGMPLALELNLPFIPVRKLGKLPYKTIKEEYQLEYGTNTMEIHADAIEPGARVLIVDDLLATGGTARAAAKLIERLEGIVAGCSFMIELAFLNGREHLPNYEILSLIKY